MRKKSAPTQHSSDLQSVSVQNSEVCVAEIVRSERVMGMVVCIVQTLPNSDNECKATVFNVEADEVLVDCGSGRFRLTDEKQAEAWPGCQSVETSIPKHGITRSRPSCAPILGMVKEVLIAMS